MVFQMKDPVYPRRHAGNQQGRSQRSDKVVDDRVRRDGTMGCVVWGKRSVDSHGA